MNAWLELGLLLTIFSCRATPQTPHAATSNGSDSGIISKHGKDIKGRFNPPQGFLRQNLDSNSFAFYLRHLPLKPSGSTVKYYNGAEKNKAVYLAVVDMELGKKDLQQCADAIMRLRGEYFFARKDYAAISFTLTNGFKADYIKWAEGYRINLVNNTSSWKKTGQPSNTYEDFKAYMEFIFTYAGTLSLDKSLKPKKLAEISIGDVFIVGGSPGHAVIVVDIAENAKGEKAFMLAQSYMPAQDTQILLNPGNDELSPWYKSPITGKLHTPEWTFETNQLKSW